MEHSRSRHLTFAQKTALWIIGLYALWRLVNVPIIEHALLELCFAGVVPGTDIVLSPDVTMGGVVFLLLSGAIVLWARHVYKHAEKPVAAPPVRPQLQAVPLPVVQPAVRRTTASAAAAQRKLAHPSRRKTARRRPAHRAQWVHALVLLLGRMGDVYKMAALFVWEFSQRLVLLSVDAVIKLLTATYYTLVALWRIAEPHLWRLDGWLEVQAHRLAGWLVIKVTQHDWGLVTLDVARQIGAKLRPAGWWEAVKQRLRQWI